MVKLDLFANGALRHLLPRDIHKAMPNHFEMAKGGHMILAFPSDDERTAFAALCRRHKFEYSYR